MEVKLDQKRMEASIIQSAVDELLSTDIHERVEAEIDRRVSDALAKQLNGRVEATLNEIMEKALDSEIHPVNTWGEREGKPTTIRAQLHDRARQFWNEKVDKEGKSSTWGGRPRYEHVIGIITAKEFESQVKQNIVNIAGAIKDSVRDGMYKQVDENLNKLFKVNSKTDQGRK